VTAKVLRNFWEKLTVGDLSKVISQVFFFIC